MLINHSTGEIIQDSPPVLDSAADTSPQATQPPVVEIAPGGQPAIVGGAEYLALPRAPETWLVAPLLPVGGTMLLYGDPKVGKSFAALQLAVALATGKDWLTFQVPSPGRVVYIQLDTPRSLWADRVASLKSSGLETDAVYFADRETLNTWPFDILDPKHQVLLAESLDKIKPSCVILDTLRESHRGDENDSTDMQNVLAHLTAAVKPAALILVAHGRKADPQRGASLINDNRGSNYVVGAVDAICHMTHKGLQAGGRAVDETFVHLEREENGTWGLGNRSRAKSEALDVLHNEDLKELSLREKAKVLAERTGKDAAACYSMLQRLK
jgi:hypothetical protein